MRRAPRPTSSPANRRAWRRRREPAAAVAIDGWLAWSSRRRARAHAARTRPAHSSSAPRTSTCARSARTREDLDRDDRARRRQPRRPLARRPRPGGKAPGWRGLSMTPRAARSPRRCATSPTGRATASALSGSVRCSLVHRDPEVKDRVVAGLPGGAGVRPSRRPRPVRPPSRATRPRGTPSRAPSSASWSSATHRRSRRGRGVRPSARSPRPAAAWHARCPSRRARPRPAGRGRPTDALATRAPPSISRATSAAAGPATR